MNEVRGDLWTWEVDKADALGITTNGSINAQGRAVMGRGVAAQARQRYPDLPEFLAEWIRAHGNVPVVLREGVFPDVPALVSIPVKANWSDKAAPALMANSLRKLVDITYRNNWDRVHLPRIGCGNGGLSWEPMVKKLCQSILDERFWIVDYASPRATTVPKHRDKEKR